MQMFNLKKFIGKLLIKRTQFNSIGKYHFALINDKAASFSNQLFGSKTFSFKEAFGIKRMILK